MNILVVSNLYPPDILGGYELGCRQVVEGLRKAGHRVTVLTASPRRPVPPEHGVLRRLKFVDVYDTYVAEQQAPAAAKARFFEGYGFNAHNAHVLGEEVEGDRPNVVYFWNLIGLGGLGLIAAVQQMGLPWVMHVMDAVPRLLCGLGQPHPAHPAIGRTFAAACRGRFLCCSETLLREVEEGGVPIRPFSRVMPNWVTTNGTQNRTDYRPEGQLRIVTAGSLSADKGTNLAIEAAGLLRDRGHTNFLLDIYGFGDAGPFQSQIHKLGLADRVRIRGTRTQAELNALYPHYDLFAFPTWAREPFGFAPLEAAAHGCIPVVSRACGFSEWCRDGVHCVKAERTATAFADVFEAAATGRLDLPALGQRTAAAVQADFHLRAVLPSIEAELRDAARNRPAVLARSAGDAYRAAVMAEKVLQVLIQSQSLTPLARPAAPVAVEVPDFNFFNHLPAGGPANRALAPLRRATRKLMLPMFQRLRDLLEYLGGTSQDHARRIANLEAALAHQARLTQSLLTEHLATQRLVTSREAVIHSAQKVGPRSRAA